jgi:TPP-dependent pyruvate/acetoin dehydrogenase alpha subunit
MVLVVEDNGYAYSTPTSKHTAVKTLADRAVAYGIPGVTIDGNDVIAVYREAKSAVDRARRGEGPTLIEVKTFRMRGHAEHDDASYVPKGLQESWALKDPVDRLVTYLRDHELAGETDLAEVDARITREIDAGMAWAEASPFPDPLTQQDGVYA